MQSIIHLSHFHLCTCMRRLENKSLSTQLKWHDDQKLSGNSLVQSDGKVSEGTSKIIEDIVAQHTEVE